MSIEDLVCDAELFERLREAERRVKELRRANREYQLAALWHKDRADRLAARVRDALEDQWESREAGCE